MSTSSVHNGDICLDTAPSWTLRLMHKRANLLKALSEYYYVKGVGSRNVFEEVIKTARKTVPSSDNKNEHRHNALRACLASFLGLYFECFSSGDEHINEAILIGEDLVNKVPRSDSIYVICLFDLAQHLRNRYERHDRRTDLEAAENCYKTAIAVFPPGNSWHFVAVRMSAVDTVILAGAANRSEVLEDALHALLSLKPNAKNNLELIKIWYTKSKLYEYKYEMLSAVDDLNTAIEWADKGFHLLPHKSSLRGEFLLLLSCVLATRAKVRSSMADIDAATDCAKRALEIAAPAEQSSSYDNLAKALDTKLKVFDRLEDLKESLEARRNAVKHLPADHWDRPVKLHRIAGNLLNLFKETGEIMYLNESIVLTRGSVNSIGKMEADRPIILDGLSQSLQMRSQLTGNSQDLDESIIASEAAVAILSVARPHTAVCIHTLSKGLWMRFDRTRNIAD
ncbi:MAG: hypothetical protein M1821_000723 [Bathelium mastoideum]|nr:MAG: hypothetical protein M1821_000723 [Bathelium mastoideum]